MEQVLVFKTDLIEDLKFQGYLQHSTAELGILQDRILDPNNLFFMDRDVAENDPSHKQIIPYCLIVDNDAKILVYERSKKGGEIRLHNKFSLGVGGHINPCDSDNTIGTKHMYINSLMRELKEEISINGGYVNLIQGMLNDDSNAVGKVHFGIVHWIGLNKETTLEFKDEALLNARFETQNWIVQNKEKFENWSQLVIENL